MKTKTLRFLAMGVAAGAAWWGWHLLGMEVERGSREERKVPLNAQHAFVRTPSARSTVRWPDAGTPAFRRMAGERALPWLATRGRDAAGLVAMWDLTGDESVLNEAALRYPDDPRVCIAMIGREAGKVTAALPWIERLLAAEPRNPYAWHLKVWSLMSAKDHASALAALSHAATAGGQPNTHAGERAGTAREAAVAAGMSPGAASRLAIGACLDRLTSCLVTTSIQRAIITELELAKAGGDEDRLMKITGLGLVSAENLVGGHAVTLREERMSNNIRLTLLSGLPGDTEIGAYGRSVASLKSGLENRREYLEEANAHYSEASERLRKSSEENVLVTYADCLLSHGEQAAISWIMDQGAPAEHSR